MGDNDNNLNDDVSSCQNNVQFREDNNNNIYDNGKDDNNTLDKMVMILLII